MLKRLCIYSNYNSLRAGSPVTNYYKLRQLSLLQIAMDSYYKLQQLFIAKCDTGL